MQIVIDDKAYRIELQHFRTCPTDIAAARALDIVKEADIGMLTDGENAILTAVKMLLTIYRRASLDCRVTSQLRGKVYRRYMSGRSKWAPGLYGGVTRCKLRDGKTVVALGQSECSPYDNFRPKIGSAIALQRAIANLMQWTARDGQEEVSTWKFVHSGLENAIPPKVLAEWTMRGYDPLYALEVQQ